MNFICLLVNVTIMTMLGSGLHTPSIALGALSGSKALVLEIWRFTIRQDFGRPQCEIVDAFMVCISTHIKIGICFVGRQLKIIKYLFKKWDQPFISWFYLLNYRCRYQVPTYPVSTDLTYILQEYKFKV